MIFSFLYNFSLFLLALATLPKIVYQYIFLGKYRSNLLKRFGFTFPNVQKGESKLIWIHAVSVGETKAVAELAKLLKKENVKILISSVTETGHEEAERSIPYADYFVFLPFDFSWIIGPIVRRVKPDVVLCSETDLWYNFLNNAKKQGAINVLINGKISERSFKRMKAFSFFSHRLLKLLDLLAVQNEDYKERFVDLMVDPHRITVTGNLKLDEKVEMEPTKDLRQALGLQLNDFVILIGSTHAPEEKLILSAIQPLMQIYPRLKILVIPRHPERFETVASVIESFDPNFGRYSKNTADRITLIDAMGVLKKCLQLSNLAIIGGSFVPGIGGHNITEPAQYGVPVLFGPYMHNQPDFPGLILKSGGGRQIAIENLAATVRHFIENPQMCAQMGLEGKKFLARMHGSTEATYQLIAPFLSQSSNQA